MNIAFEVPDELVDGGFRHSLNVVANNRQAVKVNVLGQSKS